MNEKASSQNPPERLLLPPSSPVRDAMSRPCSWLAAATSRKMFGGKREFRDCRTTSVGMGVAASPQPPDMAAQQAQQAASLPLCLTPVSQEAAPAAERADAVRIQ